MVKIKYEGLPHFCFHWGHMSHVEKDCLIFNDEDKEHGIGWGLTIRASPRRGITKIREEITALKLKPRLFVVKPKVMESASNPCGFPSILSRGAEKEYMLIWIVGIGMLVITAIF